MGSRLKMDGFSTQSLKEIHPIFNFTQLNIFSIDNVFTNVDHKMKTKSYFFLISNAGVFLLKGKGFRQSATLIDLISFFDLVAIKISNDKLYLFSNKTTMNISAQNAYSIGERICHIRNSLFPLEFISFSIETTFSGHPFDFSNDLLDYKTDNILIDRTLSCFLHYFEQNQIEKSTKFQFHLSDYIDHETLFVTDENSKNPIIQSVLDATAFDDSIKVIVFNSINLHNQILNSNLIYKFNKFIQKVVYEKVVFETKGTANIFSLLQSSHLFHPVKFRFSECLFTDIQFFNNLSLLNTHIHSISFDRCTFRSEVDHLFGTFNQNQTFRSLRKISIDSLNIDFNMEKLFRYHHLRNSVENLVLSQVNTDSSAIIESAFSTKSNLKSLAIINNDFLNPIQKVQSVNFPIFLNLTLHSQTTCYSSLNSLLQCITQPNIVITRLNLSGLKMPTHEFDNFIQNLSKFVIPHLKSFIFDDNPLNSKQLKSFSDFLNRQKKLSLLSVNRSISASSGTESISLFLNTIKESAIQHFFIQADFSGAFNIGPNINSFLHDILFDNKFSSLDISYQELGEEGVDFLIELIHTTSIENLWFDEISVPDFASMLHLCTEVLNSKLKYAKYPSKELNMLAYQDEVKTEMMVRSVHNSTRNLTIEVKIGRSPSFDKFTNCQIRTNIAPEVVKIKNSFRTRFGTISLVKTLSEIKDTDEDIYEMNYELSYFKDADFTFKNEIVDIYNECFDIGNNDVAHRNSISNPIIHSLFHYESQISMREIDNTIK